MRVALLAPPWFPVPPAAYGGIEAVVGLLAEGLVAAGVDVTLFASGDSVSAAELDAVHERAPSAEIGRTLPELAHVLRCLGRAADFDLVHDHTGPLAIALLAGHAVPAVHTVHGPLTGTPGRVYADALVRPSGVGLVSLSMRQRAPRPRLPWAGNVPNAIDLDRFECRTAKDDYLLFLGRMSEDKGAHHAIRVARAAGLPLRIAAKCREPEEIAYFEREIAPYLGADVEWLGEVGHAERRRLLAGARALLFPIGWEEPFGLVMVEAIASGTPVVATRRGAVPEVVDDGVTGFVVGDVAEMPRAVRRVASLDPAELRAVAEARFSPARLVEDYLHVYEAHLWRRRSGRTLRSAADGTARTGTGALMRAHASPVAPRERRVRASGRVDALRPTPPGPEPGSAGTLVDERQGSQQHQGQ